jgi:4-hydroxythreonine-4-phosphate dehydrogenase
LEYSIGKINGKCGFAAYSYIEKAITLAQESQIDGIITNPINKESLKLARIPFPGHTEIFAQKTEITNFSMVLKLDHLYVAHVTTHCSLKEAIETIDAENVYKTIKLLHDTLKNDFGINNPVIGIGGLNPHAGEGGLFGNEELQHIIPAINRAEAIEIEVKGPLSPDTMFMRGFNHEFNGIISMIHDHGFTALKSRNFNKCINITIGLPIIRTSVGHGTAFDIAGTGKASEQNLIEAIIAAYEIYKNKNDFSSYSGGC